MKPNLFGVLLSFFLAHSSLALASAVDEAIANPARSEEDKALDAKRKPAAVLNLVDLKPGMAVIDIFGGGGYYAELFSYVVGEDGFVTLYNNTPWSEFVTDAVKQRFADNRLPNVDVFVARPEDLDKMTDEYDAAFLILGMHDIYYADPENKWPAIDREKFLKGIYSIVAEGGLLGIIDHNALPGTDPTETGKTLHRIDPAIIIRDVEAAGFKLEKQSDILRNPADDLQKVVFDPAVRWQTDQSVLLFRKP